MSRKLVSSVIPVSSSSMDPARAQGGADACADIEAKKPAAVHGRIATPETATQERTHEDRRGQDDDRSRRRRAGDHPAGPRIHRRGGRRTRQNGRIAGRDSTGWNQCSGRRSTRRETARELPSDESGLGVRCARLRTRSRGGRWIEVEADGAVGPENDLQHPTRDILPLQADQSARGLGRKAGRIGAPTLRRASVRRLRPA